MEGPGGWPAGCSRCSACRPRARRRCEGARDDDRLLRVIGGSAPRDRGDARGPVLDVLGGREHVRGGCAGRAEAKGSARQRFAGDLGRTNAAHEANAEIAERRDHDQAHQSGPHVGRDALLLRVQLRGGISGHRGAGEPAPAAMLGGLLHATRIGGQRLCRKNSRNKATLASAPSPHSTATRWLWRGETSVSNMLPAAPVLGSGVA